MGPEATDTHARADWDDRIGRRSGSLAPDRTAARPPVLPAPSRLQATSGRGQVTLDWDLVPGAIGYLVHAAPGPAGPWAPLDHYSRDVLAVPHPPYADTTGEPGRERWYAVAALSDVDTVGPVCEPVAATPAGARQGDNRPVVELEVDASATRGTLPRPWEPMIGCEHLSYLLSTETVAGRPIGVELQEALRLARMGWGVRAVRAHGILCDDLAVYREVDGQPVHDFTRVDRVYDTLLDLGLRPVVELSFMPRDLARDATTTVFTYGAIISPPEDWGRWADLVHELVAHLVQRYGLSELREHWSFELWNEPNLEVFWSGTPAQFWQLYEVTAAAVKSVDSRLRIGGPATAAAAWIEHLLTSTGRSGAAVDFVSTHTYGSPPLDFGPALARHGRGGVPIWWTEWGVSPSHFDPINDTVLSAAFLLRGMRSALGRIDALAYWVVSDHFEELGRAPSLLHGGFGLLTVGNLKKPRFWALELLGRLGTEQLAVTATGDGADSLVESIATRDGDGVITVLVWNSTLDQSKADLVPAGAPGPDAVGSASLLDRRVLLRVHNLDARSYTAQRSQIEVGRSDVRTDWQRIGCGAEWPDGDQWDELRSANVLAELPVDVVAGAGWACALELPMPSITCLRLVPRK